MIKFTKTVATGNDFVIIDNRKNQLKNNLSELAVKLCDRKYGAALTACF
jgi:diaminopimelate epimerase